MRSEVGRARVVTVGNVRRQGGVKMTGVRPGVVFPDLGR